MLGVISSNSCGFFGGSQLVSINFSSFEVPILSVFFSLDITQENSLLPIFYFSTHVGLDTVYIHMIIK